MKIEDINIKDYKKEAENLIQQSPVLIEKISAHPELESLKAERALAEVLKFLHLIGVSGEKLTPSLKVDLAWHEFILCTRLYHEYCQKEFGRYIHHHPGGDKHENENNHKKTLVLYRKHFGAPPFEFWVSNTTEAECGSCEGEQ